MKKFPVLMLVCILLITSITIPIGNKKALAEVVTAYPQYVDFERNHYGELISSGYVENPVLGSSTVPASERYGWKAGTYYRYAKSITAHIPIPASEVGKYRYWIVVEPTVSVTGNGGNSVTSFHKQLAAFNNQTSSYDELWNDPQNGLAVGASAYSVYTQYHVISLNGDFAGSKEQDVATNSQYDIDRINYFPASPMSEFQYTHSYDSGGYESLKSVSYRVYRNYIGITQAPEISVSPNQDYQKGNSNSFTIAAPSHYANNFEKTNGVLQYRLNGGNWVNYFGKTLITSEGQTEIESRLVTNGSLESVYATAYSRQDNTPPTKPTIKIDPNRWYQSVNIIVEPGIDASSGVAGVDYSLSGAVNQSLKPLTGMPVLTTEGITTVKAVTRDNVGLSSEEVSQQVKIDRTPPASVLNAGTAPAKSNTIKIQGFDNLSGMMFIGLPNNTWYNGAKLDYPVTKNGTYTFKFQDAAENISSQSITITNIDDVLPEIKFSENGWNWIDHDKNMTISYSDPLSGAASGVNQSRMFYKVTDSKLTPLNWDQATSVDQSVKIPEGQWYIHAKVEDLAGNVFTTVSNLYQVQYQPQTPVLNLKGIATNKILLSVSLPNTQTTDGYVFTVKNINSGKSWTLAYPQNSIVDEDLSGGMEYEYTVQAKNHVGESEVSQIVRGITLPPTPLYAYIFPKERDFSSITTEIDPVKSATGFEIKATDWVSGQVDINTTVTKATYADLSGLKPYRMYDFSFNAINASGSGSAFHTSFLSLPDKVDGFKSVQINQNSIDLIWNTVTGSTYHNSSVTSDTYYELNRDNTTIFNGLDTRFLDEHLDAGTAYNYALAAGNNTGMGSWSYLSQVYTLPAAVTGLKQINASTNSVTIAIKNSVGATGYQVDIDNKDGLEINGNPTSFDFKSLEPGKTYLLKIKPKNSSGYGKETSLFVTTLPAAPVNGSVQVTDIGEESATFIVPTIEGATQYRLNVNNQSYKVNSGRNEIAGLKGGENYTFRLAAGNEAGYGEETEGTFLTLPVTPKNLKIVKHSPSSFSLTWDEVKSATAYIVRNEDGTMLDKVSSTSYDVTKLKAGSVTTIKIEGINETGSGKQAIQTWRTIPGLENTDLNGLVTVNNVDDHHATLEWTAVPGADSYVIYDQSGQVAGVSETIRFTLSDLVSAQRFDHYTVAPLNTAGEGIALKAPSWVTKPSDAYETSYTSTKKNAQIAINHQLANETFVFALRDKEIYRGKDKMVSINDLFPDSNYTLRSWTENDIGDKSIEKTLTIHTSKVKEIVLNDTTNITDQEVATTQTEDATEESSPTVDSSDTKNKKNFKDIDKSFAKSAINRLAEKGIVQGITDEMYEPTQGTTRAEFMALLVRLTLSASEIKAADDQHLSFADINSNGWYIPELKAAMKNNIAKGFSNTDFKPDMLVDREQASKMIASALFGGLLPDGRTIYSDNDLIAPWANQEVLSLTDNNIVEGFPDQTFRPKNNLTRAEAAAVIDRAMNKGFINQ